MSKLEIIDYLQECSKKYNIDILSNIWYCEEPIFIRKANFAGYIPCGICQSCIEAKKYNYFKDVYN